MIVEKEIENNNNKREENQNEIKIENKEEKIDEVPKKEETKSNNNIDSNEKEIKNEIKEEKKEETAEIKENDNNRGKTKEKIKTDKEKKNNIDYNSGNSLINQLNEEEKLIVNKIKNIGNFPVDKVVEAFIVCNKNEELTVNYLFEQYM